MQTDRSCHDCRHAGRQDDGRTLATDCWHPHSRFPPAGGEVMSTRFHPMAEMLADEEACGSVKMWWEPLFAARDAQAAWVAKPVEAHKEHGDGV
jgi:hypothetical protein